MAYIGRHGVEALHRYKYSGVDRSYLAKYVLQPFWSRCVNLFPLWMPPNMITLLGFLFIITSAFLSYVYSPQLDSPPPKWVHFMHGLLLFLYQTFDAVDGKQARRTNSSSPLGELFDHGCDALTCAFETMAFGNSIMSGRHTIWFWVIAAVPFYCATWESFFTNTLILPEINGPTEGLMLIYALHFFTSFVGAEWWAQDFRQAIGVLNWVPFIPDIPLYQLVLYFMIVVAVAPTVGYNVYNVYKVVQARKGNMLHALAMLFPFITLLGGVLIWYELDKPVLWTANCNASKFNLFNKELTYLLNYPSECCHRGMLSPSDVLATQPHLLLVGNGFAFGYMVGRMILAHLCDEPKGLKTGMCMSLLFLPLAIANALSAKILGGVPLLDERWLLLGYCTFTVTLYMHFAINVIQEITAALGIQCFRITRKEA